MNVVGVLSILCAAPAAIIGDTRIITYQKKSRFGPADVEPLLGVTAIESVGIIVDPAKS
jgi:hypothetical protein